MDLNKFLHQVDASELDSNGQYFSVTAPTYTKTITTTNTGSSDPWGSWIPSGDFHEALKPKITMEQEQFARMFQPIEYLNLPEGLDMSHPTVVAAVGEWYAALEQLKVKHSQLKMLNELAKENESNGLL